MADKANPYQLDLGIARAEPVVLARPVAAPAPKPSKHRPEPEKVIDWFQVITALSRNGYSLSSIAAHISVPKATISGWKHGAEPRYTEGERLVAFWCQVTSHHRDKLPTCSTGDWWAYHSKV